MTSRLGEISIVGLVLLSLAVEPACHDGRSSSDWAGRKAALETRRLGDGSLTDPLRINPKGPYLLSPLPGPEGQWLAASGRLGKGLVVISTDGRGSLLVLDESYRGPKAWTAKPAALNFGHELVEAWLPATRRRGVGHAVWHREWEEELGRLVGRTPFGEVFHHPKKGTVTLVSIDGEQKVRGGFEAWGVRLSPDGLRVAWCSGTLAAARLFVWELGEDRVIPLGRGAQPAWSSDGHRLVFVRPEKLRRIDGYTTVVRSELRVWTVGREDSQSLPLRKGLAPMDPVFGPAGKWLYFSDWRDGALFAVRWDGQGGAS